MKKKEILLQSLIGLGALALALRALAGRRTNSKPDPQRASSGRGFEDIDAYVEAQMKRLNIPGAALVIVEGDQIVHQRGFGQARPSGDPPSPQTPFFIGSLTKSITALAVMQLVEAGKIELDAPVQRYLPWFRLADPQASAKTPALAPERSAGASVTVRHLLNQTSGLPGVPGMAALADFDDRPDATERQVRALSRLKITRPVGSKWEYSNLNYNILGLIVEAASGESYTDYIQNHIFNPLEMRLTFTSREEAKQNGLAKGHRHWFGLPFPAPDMPVPRGSLPSGQLISCTADMAHYLIAHLNGGRYGEVQVLSEAGVEELHRGVAEYTAFGESEGRYGMGWFEIDLGQTKTFSHGGNIPDFSAFMALIPGQKRGVALLLKADPYGLPFITAEIGEGLTAVLAGQQPAPIKLDFIQWIFRLLPLIPILQIVGVITTLRLLRNWHRDPVLRPSRGRVWGQHILPPLVPNLALVAALAYLRSSGLLGFIYKYMPDLYWIARISGEFARIWASLRTSLILRALRKSSSSKTNIREI